jgi:hypothetical protein
MKHLMKAIITLMMISVLFLTSCDDLTPKQNDILNEAKATVTENTTVKEFIDEITKQIEKHADNETVWYIPKKPAEEPEMNPRIKQNTFNSAELILVESTPEEYVFRMDFYQDGQLVNFSAPYGTVIFLYLWEGGFTPDWTKGASNQKETGLLLNQTIDGSNFDWYRYPYESTDDLIHLKKAEILPTEEKELTVIIMLTADNFRGNHTGIGPDKSMELHSFVWMNIPKDW